MTDSSDASIDGPSRRDVLKRGVQTATLLGGGAVALSGVTAAQDSCDVVVDASGGADFETIQDAVEAAAAGETICVRPGTYGGTVSVDVPDVTLRSTAVHDALVTGSDRAVDPALVVEADGVTVDGFGVSHPGGLLGVAVESATDGVTIRNTLVSDVGPVGRLAATGILTRGPHEELALVGNRVEGIRNEVTERSGFPTANGIVVDAGTGGTLTDSTIAENVVRDLTSDVAVQGLRLGIDMDTVVVRDNVVRGLTADPATDTDDTDDAITLTDTFAQGVTVGGATTAVTVSRNVIEAVVTTHYPGTALQIDGDADGLAVTLNDLLASIGLSNTDDDAIVATCNYWGHTDGPRVVPENRVATAARFDRSGRSAVVGPVQYEPWLVRSIQTNGNAGNACVGGRASPDGPGTPDGPTTQDEPSTPNE